ncbi:MAG: hypothetical protein H0W65_05505 [Sphingomonas sp.]|uniref:hypothetical protein n=1 Tax=Sphingomonas sp. TaxID=28214 RepID=UPI0018231F5D|nr:hypothetical protein [Sphingomonas sp.]MBA3667159.1 hypothetical protein [Sphingomonas sp.]
MATIDHSSAESRACDAPDPIIADGFAGGVEAGDRRRAERARLAMNILLFGKHNLPLPAGEPRSGWFRRRRFPFVATAVAARRKSAPK